MKPRFRFGPLLSFLAATGLVLLAAPHRTTAACLECDTIYATGCNFEVWKIDPVTLVANNLGATPEFMFDIAATADGRLFGLSVSGTLYEIDPCTGSSTVVPGAPGGN